MVKKKTPEKEFVFHWKQSLLQNSFWIVMMIAAYGFGYLGIATAASLENEMLKIMALIFTLFFTLKLLAWNRHPRIVLMEKE